MTCWVTTAVANARVEVGRDCHGFYRDTCQRVKLMLIFWMFLQITSMARSGTLILEFGILS
jgi:hypothetical protein